MKILLLAGLFAISLSGFAQKGITFQVEKLSKPAKKLIMRPGNTIYERMILSEKKLHYHQVIRDSIDYPYHIVARSELPDSLVYNGNRPFFNGVYQAYADHRPFVLSPDMIWLLISQGFARHVAENSEKLRMNLVNFSGEQVLQVEDTNLITSWEMVFSEFAKQIARYVGKDLVDALSADFSTTTLIEQTASRITIMEAVKSYFKYEVLRIVCGIPEITLQGTTEDWEKIRTKISRLAKYDLAWWVSELDPVLKEFVNASKGEVNTRFWRSMFKLHKGDKCGDTEYADGWIIKFFPYDKKGKRNSFRRLNLSEDQPDEIVKVDLKSINALTGDTTFLELWSGFVGLEQNKENYALTPKIGWMIRQKDVNALPLKIGKDFRGRDYISMVVKEFPVQLLELKKISSLKLQFIGKIEIPDRLGELEIDMLKLTGDISQEEIDRIKKILPDTAIQINGEEVNRPARYSRDGFLIYPF